MVILMKEKKRILENIKSSIKNNNNIINIEGKKQFSNGKFELSFLLIKNKKQQKKDLKKNKRSRKSI